MGNPAYDARRAAEQAEADAEKAAHDAMRAAAETFKALMTGHASITVGKTLQGDLIIRVSR